MSFGFKNIEHAIAVTARDVVVGAKAVTTLGEKVAAAAPEIEAVTGVIDPPAVVIERAAFAALGMVTKAANDTSTAAAAKGLNVPIDQDTLKDFQQIYNMIVVQLKGKAIATEPPAAVTKTAQTA